MTQSLLDKYKFFPEKLKEDALFKKFLSDFDGFTLAYEATFSNVIGKYNVEDLDIQAAKEVLNEMGLSYIADLLIEIPNIDPLKFVGYASAISTLKGRLEGVELVLKLLGFDYLITPWYEQTPKGVPNTFYFEVYITSSIIERPFIVFQKIKKFIAEYVLPIIDPLIYNIIIEFSSLGMSHHGFAHPTYLLKSDVDIPENLLFSNTRFILLDENSEKWNIKVNTLGELKAFKTEIGNEVPPFALEKPDSSLAVIKVDSNGDIFAEDATGEQLFSSFSIFDLNEVEWFLNISNLNEVFVTN